MSSNTNSLIHPITKTFLNDEKDKYLSMPHGPTNNIESQKMFSKTNNNISENANELFFSDSYFFTAIFNANTFDEKILTINNILDSGHNVQTVGFILGKFINTLDNTNDKNIEELIKMYDKYYKKYENVTLSYSELYDLIKNKL